MMEVCWFGEPWPTREARAPICGDDARRVDTPVGRLCVGCEDPVIDGERGLITAASPSENSFALTIDGDTWEVCAWHIDCMVRATQPAWRAELVERVPSP